MSAHGRPLFRSSVLGRPGGPHDRRVAARRRLDGAGRRGRCRGAGGLRCVGRGGGRSGPR
ncbi:hypothetical protein SFR_0822 [Streptomyces sp. FR-008]|nr:hypothetical protein SFR_0822 [Streptomyces sp. FR-008]